MDGAKLVAPALLSSLLQSLLYGVGCFLAERPFETLFQPISGRLRKKREMIDERKNVQTTPPAPIASAVDLCP